VHQVFSCHAVVVVVGALPVVKVPFIRTEIIAPVVKPETRLLNTRRSDAASPE